MHKQLQSIELQGEDSLNEMEGSAVNKNRLALRQKEKKVFVAKALVR